MRTAEAAKEKEKDSFSVVAGNEHRRRMAAALATTVSAAEGLTAEVIADADRLERERQAMLVPQVSALVGCQVREKQGSLRLRAGARAGGRAYASVGARDSIVTRGCVACGLSCRSVWCGLERGWLGVDVLRQQG